MSASNHTPGPWTALLGQFDYGNDGSRRVMCGDPDGAEYRRIASIDTCAERKLHGKNKTRYDAPDAERDANARLIAAAPELLAALRDARTTLGIAYSADVPFMQRIDALLAKVNS